MQILKFKFPVDLTMDYKKINNIASDKNLTIVRIIVTGLAKIGHINRYPDWFSEL